MPVTVSLEEERIEIERLFETHHQVVYRAARRVTGNASDAEDVLQTVFVRLLQRGDCSRLHPNPGAYLRRAAVNAALDLVRRQRSRQQVSLENCVDLTESRPGPEQQSCASELGAWLRRALAALPPRPAEMFALRFLEGLSNVEIASIVGTSENTVAVTLHRTRSRLERDLQNELGGK